MILRDELFLKFTDLIYKKTGIFFEIDKKYFVQKRLEKRIEETECEDFREYYQMLKFSSSQDEFDKLVNELTINETYFFRDYPQLQHFAEEVLPIVVKQKERNKDYSIRIWSAACSTGEEPYTLSIIMLEMLENHRLWEIDILATDINTDVLAFAQNGIYESRAVKDVPEEYMQRYFIFRNGKYIVSPIIKRSVRFRKINLYDSQEMQNMNGFDFIFCRNCLIYFDDESRRKVVESFYRSLNSGGFIFLGHSESISRISSAFKIQKIGNSIAYSKP